MKKLLVGLFIFGFLFVGVQQVHASVLSEALLQIKNLKNEMIQLQSRLRASVLDSSVSTTPTSDLTPRISYYSGKVNQHVDIATATWQSDPDGTSGAGIDKLTYCKKWYPNTTSVADYKTETINSWHDAGNINNYTSTRMSYRCVEQQAPIPSITVLSPNGGESYKVEDEMTIKWGSNISYTEMVNIYLVNPSIGLEIPLISNTPNDGIQGTVLSADTVLNSYGSNFKIVIRSSNTMDVSDNYFTILQVPIPIVKSPCSPYGDVDNDGYLSEKDTTLMTQKIAGTQGLTYDQHKRADVNKDGAVTVMDITFIKNVISGSSSSFPVCTPVPTIPSITITSPNGGETYTAGQKITVKWKSENVGVNGNISINLLGEKSGYGLADYTSNDGEEIVTLPSDLNGVGYQGNKFLISVGIKSFETPIDYSDNYFTINSTPVIPTTCVPGASIGQVKVSLSSDTPASSTFSKGTSNANVINVKLSNEGSQNVCMNGIHLGSYTNLNNYIHNTNIIDGSTGLPIGSSTNFFTYNNDYYYSWVYPNSPISIPVGSSKIFRVYSDIQKEATSGNFSIGIFGLNFKAQGASMYPQITNGNMMTVKDSSTIDYGCASGQIYSSTTGQACPSKVYWMSLISPEAGKVLSAGQTYNVKWDSNIPNYAFLTIKIKDNQSNLIREIKIKNDGQEIVKIPLNTLSGTYKFEISNGSAEHNIIYANAIFTVASDYPNIGCLPGQIFSSVTGERCSNVNSTVVQNIINSCGQTLFTDLLRIGSKGDQAESLQVMLNDQGYLSDNEIDGSFGYKTWKALKAFQISNGLKGDGVMGKQTRAYFNTLWNKQCMED